MEIRKEMKRKEKKRAYVGRFGSLLVMALGLSKSANSRVGLTADMLSERRLSRSRQGQIDSKLTALWRGYSITAYLVITGQCLLYMFAA